MPKIKVNDIELYYEIQGEGAPLVLIPGFGTGLWLWFKQREAFAQKFRTILFDPRGMGQSTAGPDGPLTVKMIADDVAGLLKALGIERAHVLGASFGGFVAQEFALAFAQMTERLVLCCTSMGGPRHVLPEMSVLQAMASTEGLNTEARVRRNLLLSFTPQFLEEHAEEVEQMIALRAANPISDETYLRQMQAAMAFNTDARLSEIKAPTLVITGDADIIVPAENSRRLASAIPNARLEIIAGGGHQFFIERAFEFNRAVIEFMEEVQSPRSGEVQSPRSKVQSQEETSSSS